MFNHTENNYKKECFCPYVLTFLVLFLFCCTKKDEVRIPDNPLTDVDNTISDDDNADSLVVENPILVDSVVLNRLSIGLLQGDTYKLQISIDYEGVTPPEVTWTTTDAAVALVDADGVISALKAGSTTITAAAGDKQAQCTVTVVANGESVYRHGYSELNADDKAIYNYMLRQILAFESNAATYSDIYHRIYLDFASQGMTVDQNKVMRLTNLIIKDVPEVYMLVNYIYRYDYDKNQYYLRAKSSCTPESYAAEMTQINAACDAICNSVTASMSEFEKAKIIHDGFIAWADYGGINNANSGDITGSFITKRAVCEGFARAYLLLCQRVNLKCVYVVGSLRTKTEPETWGNHAWNLTQADGVWYLVDITGDGSFPNQCGWNYFLRGSDWFSASYKYESTGGGNENIGAVAYITLPVVSASDYVWERP